MTSFAATVPCRGDESLANHSDAPTNLYICKDGVTICASARIDNRADLASALGLDAGMPLDRLLLAGWHAWNTGMADRLRGAFSLIIQSTSDRLIYVARDVFGLAPVYYAQTPSLFAVADSSRTVRALSGVEHAPDRRLLADFLSEGEGHRERTFFQGVHRLPPGHWLTLSEGEIKIEQYWSPAMAPHRAGSQSDAPERFRDLFDRAVAHSYEAARTGLLLSGGLDSSAIAGSLAHALGAGAELTALSMTYDQTPKWHDKPHIEALRATLPFSFADMPADSHDPLDQTDLFLATLDGPYFSYGRSVTFAAKRALAERGVRVVLTGHGGDEIVSYGFGRLNELAREGRWRTLWTEAKLAADLQHVGRWPVFSQYLDHVRMLRRVRSRLRRFRAAARTTGGASILTEGTEQFLDDPASKPKPARNRPDHDERMVQEWALSSGVQATALEVIALSSRVIGIETRMPFYDRELAEFSLSLPSDSKLGEGYTRLILRKAMQGRVPANVLARSDKFSFTRSFIRGLLSNRERLFDLADPGDSRLTEFVSSSKLRYLRNEVSQKGAGIESADAFTLWRVAVTAQWLDLETRPAQWQPINEARPQ